MEKRRRMAMEERRRVAMTREMMASGEAAELRRALGCTLDEFAALASLPSQALSRWEQGESRPSSICALTWWRIMAKLERRGAGRAA